MYAGRTLTSPGDCIYLGHVALRQQPSSVLISLCGLQTRDLTAAVLSRKGLESIELKEAKATLGVPPLRRSIFPGRGPDRKGWDMYMI